MLLTLLPVKNVESSNAGEECEKLEIPENKVNRVGAFPKLMSCFYKKCIIFYFIFGFGFCDRP